MSATGGMYERRSLRSQGSDLDQVRCWKRIGRVSTLLTNIRLMISDEQKISESISKWAIANASKSCSTNPKENNLRLFCISILRFISISEEDARRCLRSLLDDPSLLIREAASRHLAFVDLNSCSNQQNIPLYRHDEDCVDPMIRNHFPETSHLVYEHRDPYELLVEELDGIKQQ